MSIVAKRQHTIGNVRQYFVDYSNVMRAGDWITSAVVTVDNDNVAITGVVVIEPHKVTFFVGGGVLNEDFTVSVVTTENNSEVNNDTIEFHVVAP